ncbi:DUF5631 domain-containing protein [Mycobacterium gordonae]|nr:MULTISPECIES: DUF5631 domain-containing protein [Mycobacterium]MBI2703009.1 DUF5631 domain-containing protein [Mycobacterium sp.]MCQ4364749.1 DUF5631 domain-containing protein [Mycobacterium gordonae]
MTDFPPGEWSPILVGDQWPDDNDLQALERAENSRQRINNSYQHFCDLLRQARTSQLSSQTGRTAQDLRDTFSNGEDHARRIAEKNEAKMSSYASALASARSLRQDLASVAADGNKEIESIKTSNEAATMKETRIIEAISRYRTLANLAAAKYSGNVLDAIQRILDAEGHGISARKFLQSHGIDATQLFRQQGGDYLANEVRKSLASPPGSHAGIGSGNLTTRPSDMQEASIKPATEQTPGLIGNVVNSGNLKTDAILPQSGIRGSGAAPGLKGQIVSSNLKAPANIVANQSAGGTSIPCPPGMPFGQTPALTSPAPPPMPMSAAVSMTNSEHCPPALAGASVPHISPTELAQSFNKGMESGAPISAAAHAVPSAPITSTEPQISHATQTIPSAAVNPQVHVADTPTPVHHTPPPDAPPPTPILAAPQPISPPTPPQPVGPLPTYGSDLRPPVSTAITPPAPPSTPLPPSGTPTSAPVTPSAGQSAPHQPAVVRQNTPPTPPHPPSTLGAQAVAATATGAAMGTASADATARKRLQRLVTAVARQQPRLAWAAGDHADNTTLLVTDLASGWIPPDIRLPSAISLLPPARRRGNLEALLGDASVTASYTPIHHLPDDGEPIPTSPRARSAPDVKELGWELNQATQWRDGLPRLAHTLAKAASAGTGVLDSELDLLHTHLTETSKRVLDSYPDNVDAHEVGNWQLLAAIDALVAGDKAGANYHIAWFLAAKTA